MRIWPKTLAAILSFAIANFAGANSAYAEAELPRLSLKSGETVELGNVSFTSNCQPILKETPVIEVLEGPRN